MVPAPSRTSSLNDTILNKPNNSFIVLLTTTPPTPHIAHVDDKDRWQKVVVDIFLVHIGQNKRAQKVIQLGDNGDRFCRHVSKDVSDMVLYSMIESILLQGIDDIRAQHEQVFGICSSSDKGSDNRLILIVPLSMSYFSEDVRDGAGTIGV
ncbi:hypothetical protein [Absidia glauca]|uniref:Uncharacterized protein n=1 Tax=Absidia glauca TaxID=4829 RepID=A0A168LYU8_ABSGL|nr:hypothetical protein [Absidia glauca]